MIIFSGTDKAKIISLFEQNLKEFIFPGVSGTHRQLILSHLKWMREQPDALHINCTLETFPETKVTNILLSASFFQKPLERKQ